MLLNLNKKIKRTLPNLHKQKEIIIIPLKEEGSVKREQTKAGSNRRTKSLVAIFVSVCKGHYFYEMSNMLSFLYASS